MDPTDPTTPLPLTRVGPPPDDEAPPDFEPPAGPRYVRTVVHATGGMGTVWLARDTHFGRDVALKQHSREGGAGAARFIHEARITGQLEHPGVVPVYELGRDEETGRPFYVMRFIRGRTLTEVARAFHAGRRPGGYEPMELVRLLTAFVSVCDTIAYAHSRGVLHRDLKGGNIVLGRYGEAIVIDWGVAKRLDERDVPDPGAATTETVTSPVDTRMGELVGTVAYMAPEQAAGRPDRVGPHTDVFGLGALLYEILTGSPPYPAGEVRDVLAQAAERQVVPPRVLWPDVPPALEAACLRAMSRDPGDRHPSAAELGREVQGWQDRQRRQAEDELRRAYDRLHRQQAALVALTRVGVFPGPDLETMLRRLVEGAARTLGVERVSVWRLSPDGRTLRCLILYETSAGRFSSGAELNAQEYPDYFAALAATDVLAADDARADPRTREFAAGYLVPLGIGAMMEVPIRPDGVLCHEHVGPPRPWLPDEQLFGLAVGHLAAHAISHWRAKGTAAPGL